MNSSTLGWAFEARRACNVGMPVPPFHQLNNYLRVVDPLVAVSRELARVAQRTMPPQPRRRRDRLHPGLSTPLWNALVVIVRGRFNRWGDKSKLARILGVPPQRVYNYFRKPSRLPDAERTLLLLLWLARRLDG